MANWSCLVLLASFANAMPSAEALTPTVSIPALVEEDLSGSGAEVSKATRSLGIRNDRRKAVARRLRNRASRARRASDWTSQYKQQTLLRLAEELGQAECNDGSLRMGFAIRFATHSVEIWLKQESPLKWGPQEDAKRYRTEADAGHAIIRLRLSGVTIHGLAAEGDARPADPRDPEMDRQHDLGRSAGRDALNVVRLRAVHEQLRPAGVVSATDTPLCDVCHEKSVVAILHRDTPIELCAVHLSVFDGDAAALYAKIARLQTD